MATQPSKRGSEANAAPLVLMSPAVGQGALDLHPASGPSLGVDDVGSALTQPHVPDIPGLHYIRTFLDDHQQRSAVQQIDESAAWLTDLERRVQNYGWRYDYRARTIDRSMRIGPLPAWLEAIAVLLYERTGQFPSVPNQAIVNEYEQGQGIAMHVDRQCFGPAVATVSLGDDWMMDFRAVGGREKGQLLLERGSALVLTEKARYGWLHGIAKRQSESVGPFRRPRERRLSLTFRTVKAYR